MVSAAFFGVASRGHEELDCSELTISRQKIVKTLFLETPIVSELLRMKLFPKFTAGDYVRFFEINADIFAPRIISHQT